MENARTGSQVARFIAVIGIISCAATASVSASDANTAPETQADLVLPTVLFHADAAGDELFDALHSSPLLKHLSKEAPGSPIQLRIFHSVHPAHIDAKNFFSGLLSIGTLGLSPVVMSGEHTLHYELYVNGQRVLRREYSANLSRKQYLRERPADATHGLVPDGQAWARSTVDLFLKDLANDDAVRALNEEYRRYFGTSPAAVSSPVPER